MWSITKVWSTAAVGLGVLTFAYCANAAPKAKDKAVVRMDGQEKETSHSPPAGQQSAQLGVGVGFFSESSELRQESFIGGQQPRDTEPQEFESDGIYNVQAWYLRPIWFDGFRWGGGVAWYNQYALEEPDAEDDDEPFVLGHLFQLGLQAEYELKVSSKLGVVFGARGGGALLFPSGDLRDQIDGLETRGFDVWASPQFGAYLGPLVGVRWPLTPRVAVRADLSAQFCKLWLYSAEGEASGITSETSATLGTTRTQLLIGLDFSL